MKANQEINELLNGHVDGELTSQQSSDLDQLLENNLHLQAKLTSFKQVRQLLHGLPRFEAPDDLSEQVRDVLERRFLLGDYETDVIPRFRHIILQRLKAVAAVIGLLAALSVIVYSIVTPLQNESDIANKGSGSPHVASSLPNTEPVRGTLVLESTVTAGIDNFLMRSIRSNGLTPYVEKETSDDVPVYVVRCHKDDIDLLVSDLRQVWEWPKFNKAVFHCNTGELSSSIRIDSVSADQVLSILAQPNPEERIKLAKLASVQNSMLEMTDSGKILIEQQGGLKMPPKPVLTGGGGGVARMNLARKAGPDDAVPVVLTIILKDE